MKSSTGVLIAGIMVGSFLIIIVAVSIYTALGNGGGFPGFGDYPSDPSKVEIIENELYVNGDPFTVKGVFYSPIPPGESPEENGGYSWVHETETYENDFSLMRDAGINTIRVQDLEVSPQTTEFLNSAYNNDIKIIMGVSGPEDEDPADQDIREEERNEILKKVNAYNEHPAVIMWVIGNEINYRYQGENIDDWFIFLGDMASEIKREDSYNLVTTANNNLKNVDSFRQHSNEVDIFGANQYSLNIESWNWFFESYRFDYRVGKPIMLTEFGMDSWDNNAGEENEEMQAEIIEMTWNEIKDENGFIGMIIFSWSDEWWKSENVDERVCKEDWRLEIDGEEFDHWFSEECFGIVKIQEDTDERIPKEAYHTVKEMWTE